MKLRRFIKYSLLGAVFGLGVAALFILLWPAPTYRASYSVAGTNVEVAIELKPMHPYLAEYERTLILAGSTKQKEQKMFPDTGGYLRTNVYSLGDGRFLIKGFFDEWLVQTQPLQINESLQTNQPRGIFIGAFDDIDHKWRFIPAAERTEQPVIPSGG